MAAPTLHAFGAIAASTGADVTVTLPTVSNNDITLIGVVVRDVNDTITMPAGWSQIATVDRGTSARYWLFGRRWLTGDPTTVLIDKSTTTGDTYAIGISYSGCITTETAWEVVGTPSTTTSDPSVFTGITPLTDDSLIVCFCGGEDNNNASIITTGTDPAGYTEHYDEAIAGTDGCVTFSEGAQTTKAATGNVSVNWNVAIPVGAGGVVIALKPGATTTNQTMTATASVVTATMTRINTFARTLTATASVVTATMAQAIVFGRTLTATASVVTATLTTVTTFGRTLTATASVVTATLSAVFTPGSAFRRMGLWGHSDGPMGKHHDDL